MSKKQVSITDIAHLLALIGGILLIISGIFSLLDLDDSILIKSQGIILGIITILCGGFITALELNKLPLKYSVLFKIDLNRGILYFVISVVLLGSGLASFLVLIAGILFIVKNYI